MLFDFVSLALVLIVNKDLIQSIICFQFLDRIKQTAQLSS